MKLFTERRFHVTSIDIILDARRTCNIHRCHSGCGTESHVTTIYIQQQAAGNISMRLGTRWPRRKYWVRRIITLMHDELPGRHGTGVGDTVCKSRFFFKKRSSWMWFYHANPPLVNEITHIHPRRTCAFDVFNEKMTSRWCVETSETPLYMMTTSNGNISTLLALCERDSMVTGEFPSQRPVTQSFDVFFLHDISHPSCILPFKMI